MAYLQLWVDLCEFHAPRPYRPGQVSHPFPRIGLHFSDNPLVNPQTTWKVGQEVGYSWLLGGWVLLPILLDWENVAVDPSARRYCYVKKTLSWVLLTNIITFLIPGWVMVKLYHKIFLELRRRLREKAVGCTPSLSSAYYPAATGSPGQGHGGLSEPASRIQNTLSIPGVRAGYVMKMKGNKESSEDGDTDNSSMDVEEFMRRKKAKFCLDQERRALITLGVLIGAYITCWSPYMISCFVQALAPEIPIPKQLYSFLGLLGWVNSCVNPIVYTVRNSDFRKAFKNIFNCYRKS